MMWFDGASWWTLLVAGLLMVGGFWYAYGYERKQRRIRESQREPNLLSALKRIHDGRKP